MSLETRQIVDFAADDNAKDMRETLYNSIYDRVAAAFESKKQEIAQNLMGMPIATEETESVEEEKEEHEDDDCKDAAKKEVKKHEKTMHGKDDE
jgi:hypothetical protein